MRSSVLTPHCRCGVGAVDHFYALFFSTPIISEAGTFRTTPRRRPGARARPRPLETRFRYLYCTGGDDMWCLENVKFDDDVTRPRAGVVFTPLSTVRPLKPYALKSRVKRYIACMCAHPPPPARRRLRARAVLVPSNFHPRATVFRPAPPGVAEDARRRQDQRRTSLNHVTHSPLSPSTGRRAASQSHDRKDPGRQAGVSE